MAQKNILLKLLPVMLAFFVMGFVDLVGAITNFVKEDFHLSDSVAKMLPAMTFFWFFILSVPTGLLVNRIGRRRTVVLSLVVTSLALLAPMFGYSFPAMMISFALLGIGNTLIQVSINPLLSSLINEDRLASTMTFGQFVKAVASFLGPVVATWASVTFGNWKLLFPVFMAVSILAALWLGMTKIDGEKAPEGGGLGFLNCIRLLGNSIILLSFIGIACHVGIDVGINTTAPEIMKEYFGMSREEAGFASSVYFLFRLAGCLVGAFALARWSGRKFFIASVLLMAVATAGLIFFRSRELVYACIALAGLGNANIFPVIVSQALLRLPGRRNEVSGLMIMGLVGGTVFPLLMGRAADMTGTQTGGLAILGVAVLYLLFLSSKLKK
ncbi:MAG: MFS transporter [Dysgonamonadaceae bacterium]|nr:MFS transporter [Dysgonamonadaceae bacterium]